jgi:Rrf2 family protein
MLSSRAKYALRAMVWLASHKTGEAVSVSELAEEAGVPRAFLEQILNDLKRRNLLISVRGKHGGFRLARPIDDISFADVIRHTDGPLALAPCASKTAYRPCDECSDVHTCPLRKILIAARDASAEILENTSLGTAAKRVPKHRKSKRNT